MRIATPEYLCAQFFMKGEPVEMCDDLPVVAPSQVHGSEVIRVNAENFSRYALPEKPEADGVLLTTSRAGASLRFADCAPVLLWGSGWAMILHSGYKGTTLNITARGLELVGEEFGAAAVREAHAWIGPCIGREHYCRDILDEWTQKGLDSFHAQNFDERAGKIFFDLAGEIHAQLVDAGLSRENITLSGIDTYIDEECYSYRSGDKTERMTLYIYIKEGSFMHERED